MPKIEVMGLDLPADKMHSSHIGDNAASSSGSNLRSSFIGMGFSPTLVDKVIEEKGEDNVDLVLETLFAYSALQKSKSESSDSLDGLFSDKKDEITVDSRLTEVSYKPQCESSDSLDSLFGDDKDTSSSPNTAAHMYPQEEPDVPNGLNDDKRASLLMMKFSLDEINFAMDKLGEDAPVSELVDFIFAAQISENEAKNKDCPNHVNIQKKKEGTADSLVRSMDKTAHLLEMGFSESQITAATEKYGSEIPMSQLADLICTDEAVGSSSEKNKHFSTSFNRSCSNSKMGYLSWARGMENDLSNHSFDPLTVKTEEFSPGVSHSRDSYFEKYQGKRPKEEYIEELNSLKRPKQEYDNDLSTFLRPKCQEARKGNSKFTSFQMPVQQREFHRKTGRMNRVEMPEVPIPKPKSCRSVDEMVAKPPYFFYGNVMNLSQDCWMKISQFLYAMEPEFVNTQFFSALSRKEGYIHNLPSENRFHILPKPPMSLEEAMPHSRKWWPSWDTRKQLSCINSETTGILPLCDRLGKILTDSGGLLSVEQERDLLHQCKTSNLVWVGRHKLAPIEPEHLERILGYPLHHTRIPEFNLKERLQSLKHCFQTDTLGYHLSVLKSMFPGGLSVLSIYSGFGGAEITLHRLGIPLKGVVSVEPCATKQKILNKWWQNTGQTGELVQLDNIQKLSSNKLESLVKKFGGFDFIICQNVYTYSSKSPIMPADTDNLRGLDFSLFCESVRVMQRVRSMMQRSRTT